MNSIKYSVFFLLIVSLKFAKAQPLLSSHQIIAEQKIYRDAKQTNVFYYMPFNYKLVTDSKGKPEFSIIQMRYTGTKATGDAGIAKFNNLLQFRVAIDIEQEKSIIAAKAVLLKTMGTAIVKPLPITKFSSILVFAGTNTAANTDSIHVVKTSYAEATDENAAINNSYWNERVLTLRLNNFDAQLVEAALKEHQSAISFAYAMYTVFSETDFNELQVQGKRSLGKEINDFFEAEIKNQKDSALRTTLIKAEAISLNINIDQWPQVIQKIDINEKVPAKYPLFDVYCYDFANDLRTDLYAKKIEIKATSVNGATVVNSFSFKASQPDRYAKSIRFAYAVKFDKPFYYRVTEINTDGEALITEWKEKKDWSELLDITSTPDKIVVKPLIDY